MANLTAKQAISILGSYAQIGEAGSSTKNVKVSNVSYKDKEGQPFMWKDADGNLILDEETQQPRAYAIVNFNAQSAYGKAEAIKALKAKDFQGATRTNLSMRMNVEEAANIAKGVRGTLTSNDYTNNDGVVCIGVETFVPNVAKVSESFDFASVMESIDLEA